MPMLDFGTGGPSFTCSTVPLRDERSFDLAVVGMAMLYFGIGGPTCTRSTRPLHEEGSVDLAVSDLDESE